MSDLRTLTDAFAELERRADAVPSTPWSPPERSPRRAWLVPAAASVTVVTGIAAGVALFAPDAEVGPPPGAPAAQQTTTPAPPPPTSTAAAPVSTAADSAAELEATFRAVLGDLATFTVTESAPGMQMQLPPGPTVPSGWTPPPPTPHGYALFGTLTSAGITGGFHLGRYPTGMAGCAEHGGECTERHLPDGTVIAYGEQQLYVGTGVEFWVEAVHPDGVSIDLHLSNDRSPKGTGELLGPHPPLTIEQLITIVADSRW